MYVWTPANIFPCYKHEERASESLAGLELAFNFELWLHPKSDWLLLWTPEPQIDLNNLAGKCKAKTLPISPSYHSYFQSDGQVLL